MFYYCVTTTLYHAENRLKYIEWLRSGHIQAVARWAKRAEIIEVIPEAHTSEIFQVKSLYLFDSKESFEIYLKEGAPSLRAEGAKIIEALGATISRESGLVIDFKGSSMDHQPH
jgi:hypothetical protein